MAEILRVYWGEIHGRHVCTLHWNIVRQESVVVVTASEGDRLTTTYPNRWVGDARITVNNIAPYFGGVVFRLTIEWNHPLHIWTDVILFDPRDQPRIVF